MLKHITDSVLIVFPVIHDMVELQLLSRATGDTATAEQVNSLLASGVSFNHLLVHLIGLYTTQTPSLLAFLPLPFQQGRGVFLVDPC
jgi:hypothetical protein